MAQSWLDSLVEKLKRNRKDVVSFLLSLLLACCVWFLYNMNQNFSANLQSRVYVRSNLPGYFPTSASAVTVEARCRANGYAVLRANRRMRHQPVTIAVDPELLADEGNGNFSLSSNALGAYMDALFGNDVRLESFIAPSYTFKFPQENHKRVPVIPVSSLTFRPQYMQSAPLRVSPDSVIVYGEPAYLEAIDRIQTRRLTLTNLSASKTGTIRLETPKRVRLSDSQVDYALDVSRYVEIRKTVSVQARNVPSGRDLSVYPSTAEVLLRCAFPMVKDRTDELQFYVDYDDFQHSVTGRCVARADALPPGVISWSLQPEIFECVEEGR